MLDWAPEAIVLVTANPVNACIPIVSGLHAGGECMHAGGECMHAGGECMHTGGECMHAAGECGACRCGGTCQR